MATVDDVVPKSNQASRRLGQEDALRIYFHLRRAHDVMPDDQGVDVSGPEEARNQALRVIDELRQKDGLYWSGWSLVAADAAGNVLFTLDLDSLV